MPDAVIQPLEVFILDANFNRLTGSIPYDSLVWHRRYYGVGEFQMQVRSSLYDPSWCYVYADDRPETGIIQKVEFDDTTEGPANGEDTIIISGFFLEELLNRLVFLVEESETEEIEHTEIIPKPIRGSFPTPTYYQDENGDYYVKFNGDQWNNCMTGEGYRYEWDPEFFDSLTEADVQPGEGMYQQVIHYGPGIWPGGKSFDWVTNMWSTSYSYVSEDGKLTIINGRDNVSGVYDIVGDPSSGSVLYKDADGSVKWVNGAVESFDDTYRRKMQRWEFAKTKEGAEIDANGNVVIRWTEYREVEGPWMLRTDLDDVSTPQDNVQWILKMTQKVFQGNFIYDKVGFTGETKTLTPSLTKIGDFFYQELQTVEASLRVMYHFESNQMIFQLWRGLDRTQDNGGQTPVETASLSATPMAVSVLSDASVLPDGYTELEYIQSTEGGGQYIDTGFKPNQDTRVVCDFAFGGSSSGLPTVFGAWNAVNTSSFIYVTRANISSGVSFYAYQSVADSIAKQYNVKYTIDANKNVWQFDGQSLATFPSSSFQCSYDMYLFMYNNGGSPDNPNSIRVYSCQIYDNGAQVRGFVPAKRDSDGAVGMYDTIGGTFYGNSGTGTFVEGPVVSVADSLTYQPNGGEGSMDPTPGYVGDAVVVEANAFTRDGYAFRTWNTQANGGGTDYAPLSEYTLTAGADVLYAQWDEVPEPPQPVPEGAGAPWAVFSDTWGTLYGYKASHDESNYRNKCYVLYEYDEPVWDADGNVAIDKEPVIEQGDTGFAEITGYTYTTSTKHKRGYLTVRLDDDREDAEIWSDQRSASPDFMDGVEFGTYESEEDVPEYGFTEADFEAWVESLKTDAETLLKTSYCDVDNLDTGTISTLRYFYDFDLGDKVDIAVEAIGMSKTARITEVEEVYESGSADIRLTMGEELLSTSKKSLLI